MLSSYVMLSINTQTTSSQRGSSNLPLLVGGLIGYHLHPSPLHSDF